MKLNEQCAEKDRFKIRLHYTRILSGAAIMLLGGLLVTGCGVGGGSTASTGSNESVISATLENTDCALIRKSLSELSARQESRLETAKELKKQTPECKGKATKKVFECYGLLAPYVTAEVDARSANAEDRKRTLGALWAQMTNPDIRTTMREIAQGEDMDANIGAMNVFCPGAIR